MKKLDILNYPTTPKENLSYRLRLIEAAEERRDGVFTPEALDMQQTIVREAMSNPFYFFNVLLWVYEPRPEHAPANKPFLTFERQDAYLRWLEQRYNEPINVSGFADKARDVGASYTSIGWGLWHWLKDDSFNMLLGSRKEDLVDKRGNPDALMFKAEYMIKNLPEWFLPEGFDMNKNRNHLIITRPDSENTISGESANPDFGRGGRYGFALFDEFGFWQWARSAWESCGESAHFRLAITTPPQTGKASFAYKLKSGMEGKCPVFTFDYSSVPWKDSTWLKHSREGKSSEEFNREVMRSYDSSSEGKVYTKEWQTMVREDKFLEYNPNLPLYVSWDFGYDGMAMLWWQKDARKNKNYLIEAYMNENKPIDFYLPFVTGIIGSSNFEYHPSEFAMINRHREWQKPAAHYGDPDVKKRSLETGRSLRDYLAMAPRNIYVQTHSWADFTHLQIRELCKVSFSRLVINPDRCECVIDSMLNSRYPEAREGSESTKTTKLPVHDVYSHSRTAYEYFIINEPEDSPVYEKEFHPAGTDNDVFDEGGDDGYSFKGLV